MNALVIQLGLRLAILLGLVVAATLLCIWTVDQVEKAFRQPVVGPKEKLIGQIGRVVKPVSATHRGKVLVTGEIWDAEPFSDAHADTLSKGEEIRVTRFDELEERVLQGERLVRE